MTTYGSIPASSSPVPVTKLEYISRAKELIKAGLLGSLQPLKLMLDIYAMKVPNNINEAITRIKLNATYFRTNYAITVLLVLFLSLLWHPISLIVFIVMMAAWLLLYFLRDEAPLVVLGHTFDDRVVLGVLSMLTLVLLFFTNVTENVLIAVLIGAVLVVLHAALRKTDDLFLDEESAAFIATPAVTSTS